MGRPTRYKAIYAIEAYKLCLLNATDAQLADFFNVSEVTVNTWKKKHPKFVESLKDGKQRADMEVAESLHARAIGYSHPEEKIFCTDGVVTRVKTVKHYPPDTAAAFIWLKNRQGWTDKSEIATTTVNVVKLGDEERKLLSKLGAELVGGADDSSHD